MNDTELWRAELLRIRMRISDLAAKREEAIRVRKEQIFYGLTETHTLQDLVEMRQSIEKLKSDLWNVNRAFQQGHLYLVWKLSKPG